MIIAFIAVHMLALCALTQAPVPAPSEPAIVLDAQFDDWKHVEPITIDPPDAADNSAVELGEVRVTCDEHFVHLLIDFGREVNAQGLDGAAMIVLDVDGDDRTGEPTYSLMGADLLIDLTPPDPLNPGKPGRGIGIRPTVYVPDPNDAARPVLNIYDIDLAFAPTHAGRRMEFRIARGPAPHLPPLFQSTHFTGQVIFFDVTGSVMDETDAFTFVLPRRDASASTQPVDAAQPDDPLARAPGADMRIMSWNAQLSALLTSPDPFIRTFRAMKPDVVMLQELTDETTEQQIVDVFARCGLGDAWHVVLGKGGGDLRCAVVSRSPLDPIDAFAIVPYPGQPDRSLRLAGAMISVAEKRLLALSVHLKCCGRMGSPEDQTRLIEVDVIGSVIREVIAATKPHGLVIAGDLNLVGSRLPLERLMAGLDLDVSPLEVVETMQLDGRSNATWADRRQPFVPGRLDYALYSGSSLVAGRGFAFDAWDLAPRWRQLHDLQADDTQRASDHLPLVFDLSWR